MENLRRQFLLEAAENLRSLIASLQSAKTVSGALRREAFRRLHTIKGTAQTFGFISPSRLAHQLETLLSISSDENYKHLFLEGIGYLIQSLEQPNFPVPEAFIKRIEAFLPTVEKQQTLESDSHDIPQEIFAQLATQEKIAARAASNDREKILLCFEVVYDLTNFAEKLVNFRAALSEEGEIIATLSGSKPSGDGKIGLRILYASVAEKLKISQMATENQAAIIFSAPPDFFLPESSCALAHIVRHGKKIAEQLGKEVEFEVKEAEEKNLPPDKLQLIFDAATHLVRNAVDHGIKERGKIEIALQINADGCHLKIVDDGRGIDTEKIRTLAQEKNLISNVSKMSESDLIELIFQPQFSTKTDVTEISGRGVGLDAVKSSIENAGGNIKIKSEPERGTTFEIFLPG